jgi:zinc transporter, ZIP family
MMLLVVGVVSGALVVGALWGLYGRLTPRIEGFVVALAGGALIVSAVLELIEPSTHVAPAWAAYATVLVGAAVFAGADRVVKRRSKGGGGAGLLAAITLDGVPENLALGVALIGAGPLEVAALSGSILLSNLPEAAGGARGMVSGEGGRSRRSALGLWAGTAAILAGCAVLGNVALSGVPSEALALIRCFAGGAVVGSLAIEVFPQAFREEKYATGVAAALGLVTALALGQLG